MDSGAAPGPRRRDSSLRTSHWFLARSAVNSHAAGTGFSRFAEKQVIGSKGLRPLAGRGAEPRILGATYHD